MLESFLAWVWIHLLLVIEAVLVVLYAEAVFRNPDLGSRLVVEIGAISWAVRQAEDCFYRCSDRVGACCCAV